jgi:hypothetical protein
MIARAAAPAVLLALLVASCGGGQAAAPPSSEPHETVIGEAPAKPGAAGAAGAPRKTLVELKRDFMAGCTTKVPNAPDYCECGWEQMTKTFSEDEMNSSEENQPKLAQLKDRIEGTCQGKLPEDVIKASFVHGCLHEEARRGAYCDCTWTEFRKKFSAAELADDATVKSERFSAARRGSVKVCGAKMPEELARDAFAQACVKDPSLKPVCDCAWKTLRGEGSAAEIEAGLVEGEAVRAKIDKACGKLRPAQK